MFGDRGGESPTSLADRVVGELMEKNASAALLTRVRRGLRLDWVEDTRKDIRRVVRYEIRHGCKDTFSETMQIARMILYRDLQVRRAVLERGLRCQGPLTPLRKLAAAAMMLEATLAKGLRSEIRCEDLLTPELERRIAEAVRKRARDEKNEWW